MRRSHLLLLPLLACASPLPQANKPTTTKAVPPRQEPTPWSAAVTLDKGAWAVAYQFDAERTALLFDASSNRPHHWLATESGTHIEDLEGLEALFFERPSATARFAIALDPLAAPGSPVPLLQFSDGSSAIHLGQFPVLTVGSRAEAEALHGNLGDWRGEQPTFEVALSTDQPMWLPDGSQATNSARIQVRGGGGYVYAGSIAPVELAAVTAIVDPGLPAWLQSRFAADITRVYDSHRNRWQHSAEKAMVLLAYGGDTLSEDDQKYSDSFRNMGYASGTQISMAIRGPAYREANPKALRDLLWFFAHEAAHQFQFQGGVRREAGADWMHEGAANTMALAVLYDMGLVDKSALERRYWKTHKQCVSELHDGPLRGKRGRAGYVCGDLFAQMTAASLPSDDLFSFWNAFRAVAQREDDGELTASRYFALLRARGASQAFVEQLEALIGTQVASPEAALAEAMKAAGLAPHFADDGGLSQMTFPAIITGELPTR